MAAGKLSARTEKGKTLAQNEKWAPKSEQEKRSLATVLAAGTGDRRTSTMLYAEPDREHETGQMKPEHKDRCDQ
jgi:hypothetical protein